MEKEDGKKKIEQMPQHEKKQLIWKPNMGKNMEKTGWNIKVEIWKYGKTRWKKKMDKFCRLYGKMIKEDEKEDEK